MPNVVRWILSDPSVPETYTVELNPNEASSPYNSRDIRWAAGSYLLGERPRVVSSPGQAKEWSWSGVFRSQEHYDELLRWAEKDEVVEVTDHLGRTFEVIIQAFLPVERTPTANTPWRGKYTMKCLLMGALV